MYVTAQRVRSDDGRVGINTFLYKHDRKFVAAPDLTTEGGCGELVEHVLQVEPLGGNKVLSFLDVVAPDDTPVGELDSHVRTFVVATGRDPLPRTRCENAVRITFHCARGPSSLIEEAVALWLACKRLL